MVDPSSAADRSRYRASDADRATITTILDEAYAEGRLDREEHSERTTQAMGARTIGDLIGLTDDLIAHDPLAATYTGSPSQHLPAVRPSSAPATTAGSDVAPMRVDHSAAGESNAPMIAVFGGNTRGGAWRVPEQSYSFTFAGGGEIDLTDAVLTADVVYINVFCMWGGLDIIVPPGVDFRNEAVVFMAGVETTKLQPPPSGRPLVVLRGFVFQAGVDVRLTGTDEDE
ncbi:DUF1707 SHOCT-like domain-containing protein [Parenemella sanctibonifatiensis]|uniref:DUF1707 SHOCT-like domain-containing protein n=1 Tax=Parenemella sanctibonifatiensis TaxID=2016505 RepID=UPI0015C6738B|nr:DUF1707 domain-containing protein [Parenemella sanctibonifatiensis]